MSVKVDLFVRYGPDTYRVATAKVTGTKVIAIPPSSKGAHETYPADGRVHETTPRVSRTFRQDQYPPLSDVTFQPFYQIEVPSSGPPPGATLMSQLPPDAFVVPAPTTGSGFAFAAVVNSTEANVVQSYVEEMSSNSTYRVERGGAGVVLLGWDYTGGSFL